eukprot:TRINITY_DN5349_c0_g1_i3.p1 TRINITY_DN5349_c0_g1~~TRINITY_DN5349_c0_g1_i3.p1  ORF type:complete len:127 (-),score=25.12 TRINITY_DN5349_c0_g1_i3:3-383(-)
MVDFIKALVQKHPNLEFVPFYGNLRFNETVKLFNQAAVIIGVEGAGLVNGMFAESTAIMVEINSEDRYNWCHYETSQVRQMQYYIIQAKKADYPEGLRFKLQDVQLKQRLEMTLPKALQTAAEKLR